MSFQAGEKVILKHTGDKATVLEVDAHGMAIVQLSGSDIEIPVMMEDLASPTEKNIKAPAAVSSAPDNEDKSTAIPFPIDEGPGIYVVITSDLEMEQFQLYLANVTIYPFVCTVHIDFDHVHWPAQSFRVAIDRMVSLGTIPRDYLNERPRIKAELIRFSTKGREETHNTNLRLKPKTLFSRIQGTDSKVAPAIYKLIEPSLWDEKPAGEDLKQYTRRHAAKTNYHWESGMNQVKIDPEEWAHFDNVIDLHIEELVADHHTLNNAEKLRVQMVAFDRFLEKAIRLGIPNIFVIHGIGKGKLRNAIASRVMNHPHVSTFRNEYHPKFGFGATEIIL